MDAGLSALMPKKERKQNGKARYMMIDLDDIMTNRLNEMPIVQIEELSDAIDRDGLYSPLEVYPNGDGTYTLIGGERRYTALRALYDHGRLDNPEVQCSVRPKPADEYEELLQMCDSNIVREDEKSAKLGHVRMLMRAIELASASQKQEWKNETIAYFANLDPRKIGTREMIAFRMQCSPSTVQKYINAIHGDGKEKTEQKVAEEKGMEEKDAERDRLKVFMSRRKDLFERSAGKMSKVLGVKCSYRNGKFIISPSQESCQAFAADYNALVRQFEAMGSADE